MDAYASYLDLLEQLTGELEQLTGLAQEKVAAVRKDDLDGLNRVLRQEQAHSLAVRSLEHRLQQGLEKLGLTELPLAQLAEHYPEPLRLRAGGVVGKLRQQYRTYQSVSGSVRSALECSLHEIEKTLEALGADQEAGAGGLEGEPEPPARLRTDIRV
jgi:hypothetical protein